MVSRGHAHEALEPGQHCTISEADWFAVLETSEPLHQWGSAFLLDELGDGSCIRAYVRDDSGAGRHTALCFDASTSARTRRGVEEVEQAARHAADLVTAIQRQGGSSLAQLQAQEQASRRFVEQADALYRELLRLGA